LLRFNLLNPFAQPWTAFSAIRSEVAAEFLPMILVSLFKTNGHESCPLLNGPPTSILHRDNWDFEGQAPHVNGDQTRVLFRVALNAGLSIDLKGKIDYLRRYKDDPWARTGAELEEAAVRSVLHVDEEQPRRSTSARTAPGSIWSQILPHVQSERRNFRAAWESAAQLCRERSK